MGLALVVGLAGGAHMNWLWGKTQADVGCCMAACPLVSDMIVDLWRGTEAPLWLWWVVWGSSHQSQQLLWQSMSAPCSTLHTL